MKHSRKVYSLRSFLSDRWLFLLSAVVAYVIFLLFGFAFRARVELLVVFTLLFAGFTVLNLSFEYLRRRDFYRSLFRNLADLDQAYFVLETLADPRFYDGRILAEALYRINKSMAENVRRYSDESREFREYIEMWIHEVKTPLATLSLMAHDRKSSLQLKRLDDYVEQVLYLVRAENVERDCLIKPILLANPVHAVLERNRDLILSQNVDLRVKELGYQVNTDQKWLEFIINQIVTNSLKYRAKSLTFSAHRSDDSIVLKIADDGIGISVKDLPRVFEKSFTGSNGRIHNQKSTGMGLYIAHTLCAKLGHKISVTSAPGQGTTVRIAFGLNDFYNIIKK